MFIFANPKYFMRLTTKILPFLGGILLLFLIFGLYFALWASPSDYQQGEYVRMMYIHVPAAWLSLASFSFMTLFSAIAFVWRHPIADLLAQESAPIGACFTFIALITGSLWGKPTWGTYWVWDARLTSVLILFFLYLAYIALQRAYEGKELGTKMLRFFTFIGFVNIPVIKGSVEWWTTLHQPASLIRKGGIAIHESMLWPLLLMAGFYVCFFAFVLILRVQTRLMKMKLKTRLMLLGNRNDTLIST